MEKIIKIYHGSQQIIPSPEIRIPKYNKDFYFGFYCTEYFEQAKRWATRFDGVGYVSEYEYSLKEGLNIKIFPEMTEEWLDFIFPLIPMIMLQNADMKFQILGR